MSAEIKHIYDLTEITGSENPNLTKWDKLSEDPPKRVEAARTKAEDLIRKPGEYLNDKVLLAKIKDNYIDQYAPNGETSAQLLVTKERIDDYIVEQLSGENALAFEQSEEFHNYAVYSIQIAVKRALPLEKGKIYPEFTTNPILRNKQMRDSLLRSAYGEDGFEKARATADLVAERNLLTLDNIEHLIDGRKELSQEQIDILSDYVYMGRNQKDPRARKLTEYCFNELDNSSDIKASVPLIGALTNCMANNYQLDIDVRAKSRFYAADETRTAESGSVDDINEFDHIINKERFLSMSLTAHESLADPRSNIGEDLYSLAIASFREVARDHCRFSLERGDNTPDAAAYAIDQILRDEPDYHSEEFEAGIEGEAWRQCQMFLTTYCGKYNERHPVPGRQKDYSERRRRCTKNEIDARVQEILIRNRNLDGSSDRVISRVSERIASDPTLLEQYGILHNYFDENGEVKLGPLFDADLTAESMRYSVDDIENGSNQWDFETRFASYALSDEGQYGRLLGAIRFDDEYGGMSEYAKNLTKNMYAILKWNETQSRILQRASATDDLNQKAHYANSALLDNYLEKLLHCTQITEVLREKASYGLRPDSASAIDDINLHKERYFPSIYHELTQIGTLTTDRAEYYATEFEKTLDPTLESIAAQIRSDYGIPAQNVAVA